MARRFYKVTRLPGGYEIGNRFLSGIGRVDLDRAGNISIRESRETIIGKPDIYTTYVSYNTPVAFMSSNGLRLYIANHSYSISTSQHLTKLYGLSRFGWKATGRAWWQKNSRWSRDGRIEFLEYTRSAASREQAESMQAEHERFEEVSRDEQQDYYAERGAYRIGNPYGREPKNKVWYKVVSESMMAQNGGHFEYKVGEWTPEIEDVVFCVSGYHVTDVPRDWMKVNSRIFRVDTSGFCAYDRSDRKAAFKSIRLVEEVAWKEAYKITA